MAGGTGRARWAREARDLHGRRIRRRDEPPAEVAGTGSGAGVIRGSLRAAGRRALDTRPNIAGHGRFAWSGGVGRGTALLAPRGLRTDNDESDSLRLHLSDMQRSRAPAEGDLHV